MGCQDAVPGPGPDPPSGARQRLAGAGRGPPRCSTSNTRQCWCLPESFPAVQHGWVCTLDLAAHPLHTAVVSLKTPVLPTLPHPGPRCWIGWMLRWTRRAWTPSPTPASRLVTWRGPGGLRSRRPSTGGDRLTWSNALAHRALQHAFQCIFSISHPPLLTLLTHSLLAVSSLCGLHF